MDDLQLMPQNVQLKVMALQPNGVIVRFTNVLIIMSRQEICQNHVLGTMQRYFRCFQILQLLLSSRHMSIQTNGQWILKNSPNSRRTSSFPMLPINTCSTSLRMKCHMVCKDTWSTSCFPKFICKWAMASHWQLLGDGFIRRALNISTTRKTCILTGMTGLMWLSTAKSISCQP